MATDMIGIAHALRNVLGAETYERLQFRRKVGYFPDLRQPRTFNEKIAWRKLYQDLPQAAMLSDKVAVRDYVAARAGAEYLNEALLITDDADAIDFGRLPSAFIAKPSHGSGWNEVVEDKGTAELKEIRRRLKSRLRQRFGRVTNEAWYLDIPPRIIVEPLLRDSRGPLADYKLFVFNGVAQIVEVISDRARRTFADFTIDWTPLPYEFVGKWKRDLTIARPARLDEMRDVAEMLAGDLDFVRVDLYSPDDERVVFGEMTLAPVAGWQGYRARADDEVVGALWTLQPP